MKKFLNKILGIVALFLFVVMPAFSAELNVYPVPAVFILLFCGRRKGGGRRTGVVEKFCNI